MQKFNNIEEAFKNAPMATFVARLKRIGLIGYLGLVVYYPILFTSLNVDQTPAYIPLAIFWLPMLFALPGLFKQNPYTYAWSNFVLMWCYMHGLTAIWTYQGNKLFIVIEIVLLTLAFIGNTYFARYRGRELGVALPKLKELREQEKQQFERNKD